MTCISYFRVGRLHLGLGFRFRLVEAISYRLRLGLDLYEGLGLNWSRLLPCRLPAYRVSWFNTRQ